MAFCQNCGSEVEGRYCAKCGAAQGAAQSQDAGQTQGTYIPPASSAGGLTENVASALCYALGLVTGILFLVIEPYKSNRNIRFHAFQSIFLHVSALVIFWGVLPALGVITGGMIWGFSGLVALAYFGIWLFMLIKTYQGEKIVLPVIGPLAQQQA